MALDKATLKATIRQTLDDLSQMDDREESREKFATDLADAIDVFVKSATIYATPDDVTASVMLSGGYPVTATYNLNSNIQ